MIIGVLKELKESEYRVSATPQAVQELVFHGHRVLVEKKAGSGSGFSDEMYINSGAEIKDSAEEIWNNADIIYKVKEILKEEYKYLREDSTVITYIHSNAHKEQTEALLKSKCISIAYEDISNDKGEWPLLSPMSELAGKGGFLAALSLSQRIKGGSGKLLANVCGVETPEITIIGCGNSGLGACEIASALGNNITMLDIDYESMKNAKQYLPNNVTFLLSNRINLLKCIKKADVVINCILLPKNRSDHLIYRKDLKLMKKNAMIIDVACDDNGAIESCKATTHKKPTYYDEGILHYCVDNIPSAFAETASVTLCNVTLPFVMKLADKGVKQALIEDKHLRRGLTTYKGKLTLKETAEKLGLEYTNAIQIL